MKVVKQSSRTLQSSVTCIIIIESKANVIILEPTKCCIIIVYNGYPSHLSTAEEARYLLCIRINHNHYTLYSRSAVSVSLSWRGACRAAT